MQKNFNKKGEDGFRLSLTTQEGLLNKGKKNLGKRVKTVTFRSTQVTRRPQAGSHGNLWRNLTIGLQKGKRTQKRGGLDRLRGTRTRSEGEGEKPARSLEKRGARGEEMFW